MAHVISDNLLACGDCVQAIANDDYSGLDYYYADPAERDERERAIRDGIAALGGYAVVGDEYGFSSRGCDVCGLDLGGDKHYVTVLGD